MVPYQLPYLGKLPLGSFIQELVSNSLTDYTRICMCLVRNASSLWIGDCKTLMRRAVEQREIKNKVNQFALLKGKTEIR